MRSLELAAPWQEEEDVEVEDLELGKMNGRDDLTESSSDEATGRKRLKHGGRIKGCVLKKGIKCLWILRECVEWKRIEWNLHEAEEILYQCQGEKLKKTGEQ